MAKRGNRERLTDGNKGKSAGSAEAGSDQDGGQQGTQQWPTGKARRRLSGAEAESEP